MERDDREHRGFTDLIFKWVEESFDLSRARDVVEWAASDGVIS